MVNHTCLDLGIVWNSDVGGVFRLRKSADGLSPEQLPLEFLGVNGRSEEWPEDETSLMIRALKDQNRPEAVFTVHPGEADRGFFKWCDPIWVWINTY